MALKRLGFFTYPFSLFPGFYTQTTTESKEPPKEDDFEEFLNAFGPYLKNPKLMPEDEWLDLTKNFEKNDKLKTHLLKFADKSQLMKIPPILYRKILALAYLLHANISQPNIKVEHFIMIKQFINNFTKFEPFFTFLGFSSDEHAKFAELTFVWNPTWKLRSHVCLLHLNGIKDSETAADLEYVYSESAAALPKPP